MRARTPVSHRAIRSFISVGAATFDAGAFNAGNLAAELSATGAPTVLLGAFLGPTPLSPFAEYVDTNDFPGIDCDDVERVNDLGWISKVHLCLPDGQLLTAHIPNEHLARVEQGARVFVDLRNAKVFPPSGGAISPSDELASI